MFTDPILNKLIETYPAPNWTDRSEFLFEDLVESIISQQLSIKAADSIFKRFKNLFLERHPELVSGSNQTFFPSSKQVLSVEQGSIKAIGVSTAKAQYIHNVATAFVNNDIEIKKIVLM